MTAPGSTEVPSGPVTDLEFVSDDELSELLTESVSLAQQDGAGGAAALSAIALEAEARGLLAIAARALYVRARTEVADGDLGTALGSIDRSRALWTAEGDAVQALRTQLGRMHILDDLGDHRAAIVVGEELVRSLDTLGNEADGEDARWLRAAALENQGVSHGYLGAHDLALDAYERAEAEYRAMGLDDEVSRPMANRGVELLELGRYAEAIATLRRAALGFDKAGDHLSVARCLVYEARSQLLRGDYLASSAALDAANGYLEGHHGGTDDARTELVRADTLASLGVFDRALEMYERLAVHFDAAGMVHDLAWARYGAANALTALRRPADAADNFQDAEHGFRMVGNGSMAAMACLGRSGVVGSDTARSLAEQALAELESSRRPAEVVAALLRSSELSSTPTDSSALLRRARTVLAEHSLPHLEWRVDREEARWLKRQGDLTGATARLLAATAVLETIRDTVSAEEYRLPFAGPRRGVEEDLIDVLLERGLHRDAFERSSLLRSRTLIERLAGRISPAPTARGDEALDAVYTAMLSAGSATAPNLSALARKIERSNSLERPVAPARAVVGKSQEHPTLVYEIVGGEILAFLLDGDRLEVVRHLTTVDAVSGLLDRLDAHWRRFGDKSLAVRRRRLLHETSLDLLQQLYLALLAGVPQIAGYRNIEIVPVGILANVPFGALHDGTSHVVERMAVSLTPKPSGSRRDGAWASQGPTLVVGVDDEHVPWIRAEAEAVARSRPETTVLVNAEATVEALFTHAPRHAVIHLACHGLNRPDNPSFSALRLGDRWLTAAEVAGLDLSGQLVVLSACSSGRQRGPLALDETNGLPRAFLAAGAGGVVVNLWQVDDQAASELMTSFHDRLSGASPAEALRSAQIDFINRNAHPYLWAPTVIYSLDSVREEHQ